MFSIDVKDTVKEARLKLVGFGKQVPFAVAKALTSTGKIVKDEEIKEIKRVFDRPTRRTTSSVYLKWATKANLTAKIWIVDYAYKGTAPVKYLYPEVHGGHRNRTRFELSLERKGYLRHNEYVVPSKHAKLNQFGNITAGTYTRVLSQLRASSDPMQNITGSAASKRKRIASQYFYMKAGAARGIWEKKGLTSKPLFIFVKKHPTYRQRLDFYRIAERTNAKHFKNEFNKAIVLAKTTARLR